MSILIKPNIPIGSAALCRGIGPQFCKSGSGIFKTMEESPVTLNINPAVRTHCQRNFLITITRKRIAVIFDQAGFHINGYQFFIGNNRSCIMIIGVSMHGISCIRPDRDDVWNMPDGASIMSVQSLAKNHRIPVTGEEHPAGSSEHICLYRPEHIPVVRAQGKQEIAVVIMHIHRIFIESYGVHLSRNPGGLERPEQGPVGQAAAFEYPDIHRAQLRACCHEAIPKTVHRIPPCTWQCSSYRPIRIDHIFRPIHPA